MKHIKAGFSLLKQNLKFDTQYRSSFWANVIANATWSNFSLFAVLAIGNVTGGLGGWSVNQMIILVGMWMIYNSVAHFFWYGNMKRTVYDIHSGKLDLILSKPIDSQFFTSFKRIITNALFGLFEGIIVCAWVIANSEITFSMASLLLTILTIVFGLVIYYCFWMMTATLGFYFEFIENATNIPAELADFSRFPVSAYPAYVQAVAFGLVPLMIITTIPAQILFGEIHIQSILYMALAATILFCITRIFWNASIKRYTSAN